jgi:putative mRNA 3-end processing factor
LFQSADHMLGSIQVSVELENGLRVGYSGDFHWPLKNIIQVDELVVDSTYGSPNCVRKYTQNEAEEKLLELIRKKIAAGSLHIKSHRGTIHRAMQILCEVEKCPILVSRRLASEIDIYRQFGYAVGNTIIIDTADGQEAIKHGRYIRMYSKGDRFPVDSVNGITVVLSAFASDFKDAIIEYSERSFSVALTDHADFNGVLEYIKATGAQFVITDNTRGGHAVELACEIRARLGIKAIPSFFETSKEWGI